MKERKFKLTKEEIKALIMHAVMMGTTIELDMDSPPDECPQDIIIGCEYIYVNFLEEKLNKNKSSLNQSVEDLLKDIEGKGKFNKN